MKSCSGDIRISYILMVIFSFPVPEPNNLRYISNAVITISCVKVGDTSDDCLVNAFVSSLSKSNHM